MQHIPIFDGHNDALTKSYFSGRSLLEESNQGQVDIPRMQKGGIAGGFFAIFTPAENLEERKNEFGFHIDHNGYYIDQPKELRQAYAEEFVDNVLAFTQNLINDSNKSISIVTSTQQILENVNNKIISMLLHIEGAEAIKPDLSNLNKFYDKGIRSIGPFWSRKNIFGEGVQYKFPSFPNTGQGLSKFGKDLIKECNKLGIAIDLAHINEQGFWDVEKITSKPLIVSHTNVHAICPSSRNLTDKQIDAVGRTNGIIGINFEPITVNSTGLKLHPSGSLQTTLKELQATPIESIIQHITYIVDRIGIDYIAFGADMDGALMPNELQDASEFQNIVDLLLKSGYNKEEVEQICYKNWVRVLKTTIG